MSLEISLFKEITRIISQTKMNKSRFRNLKPNILYIYISNKKIFMMIKSLRN